MRFPIEARPPCERIEADGQLVGTAEDGGQLALPATGIRDGAVHLDGNSPLAGQTPVFEARIREIRTPTGPEQAPARPAF